MAVYSLAVEGVKNFSNLWIGVPIAERIGGKGGSPKREFYLTRIKCLV